MSPVEPRPLVMGTIGAPSRDGVAAGLCVFPKMPAAVSPAGVNRLLAAPIAARNARRLHPNFISGFLSARPTKLFVCNRRGWIRNLGAPDDFNKRIARNPFDGHAGARRSLARGKISAVDLVQCVVLRLVGIESGLARWHRDTVGQWQGQKYLEMEGGVHGTSGVVDRLL